jgi:cytochrome c2
VRSPSTNVALAWLAAILFVVALAGIAYKFMDERARTRAHAAAETGGDPLRGEALFIQYGCGSCHRVKNVRTAAGMVGPPLDGIALRVIIGGHLANTPDNMQRWIRDPQHVAPGTAMPDLNVGADDARDITAFLYTRAK